MFKQAEQNNVNYGGTMVMVRADYTTSQGGTFATPADPMFKKSSQVEDDGTPYGLLDPKPAKVADAPAPAPVAKAPKAKAKK